MANCSKVKTKFLKKFHITALIVAEILLGFMLFFVGVLERPGEVPKTRYKKSINRERLKRKAGLAPKKKDKLIKVYPRYL